MKRRYIYHVQAVIGRNSWTSNFFVSCENVDDILTLLLDGGYDSTNAYGEPKEQEIRVNHIQKIATCHSVEESKPAYIIDLYRMHCDIKPHDTFL
jgi:hypothetical protein